MLGAHTAWGVGGTHPLYFFTPYYEKGGTKDEYTNYDTLDLSRSSSIYYLL